MFTNNGSLQILESFYKKVLLAPDEVFIRTLETDITYREASVLVNSCAKALEKCLPQAHGNRILLYMKHSFKIVISVLAVLKTGNSYVPVKVEASENVLAEIADITGSNIIITDQNISGNYKVVNIDECRETDYQTCVESYYVYDDNEEVYVLFTSGSTGIPKGCSVTHKNLEYILHNMDIVADCEPGDVCCFSTPYTFDVSTTEIFSFIFGAQIFVCDTSDYRYFKNLPELFQDKGVTHYALSPSGMTNIFRVFPQEQVNLLVGKLKCLMVAGEAFKSEIYDRWNEAGWSFRLWNLYGPTEATVYATGYEFKRGDTLQQPIPIGECLVGCGAYIDNPDEQGIGELILSGAGITNGYINNDEETDKRFFC